MFDPTIHTRTISRHLRSRDFFDDPSLFVPANLEAIIEEAVELGSNGFAHMTLVRSNLRGKDVFQVRGLPHNLVLRHITSNIRRVTSVKQDDRKFIISCIASLVSEGTPFRVYKYDIKSFYETVHANSILQALGSDLAFSPQSVRILRSLFAELDINAVPGLPRGMAISATLAEYLLRPFDAHVSNSLGVWYYSRFVDDMIVITDGTEDVSEFNSLLSGLLPSGLSFNKKSNSYHFTAFEKGAKANEGVFDFLGYRFAVSRAYRDPAEKKIRRDVVLDIAPSKVRKIKSRYAKSLLTYRHDGCFDDLHDRIKILTSNFTFVDKDTNIKRTAGIYFNYPLISANSPSLSDLDKFARNVLTSSGPKNKLYPALSKAERLILLRLSFREGYRTRRFFSFKPKRLSYLTDCWYYA